MIHVNTFMIIFLNIYSMPNCADYGNEDLHKADIAKEMKKAEAKSRRKTKSCKIRQLQELQLGVPLVSMDEILGTQEDPIIKVFFAIIQRITRSLV